MEDNKKPVKSLFSSFKTRSFAAGGYSVLASVIVIAIVITVNVLFSALPTKYTKFDITSNKLFTISDQTEKLAGSLESDVDFYWIVRDGYEDTSLRLLLESYENLSDHIKVTKKDPEVYPTFASQYTSSVNDNSVVVVCGDRYKYVDYYDIYEYDYSNYYYDGTYDVSFAGESAVTSALDYVVSENLPKVYFLSGHGESDLSDTFLTDVQNENIMTDTLSLLTVDDIPEDADMIIINSPENDISQKEAEVLSGYLSKGGNLFLITNPLQDGNLTNLEGIMAEYGITAAKGIVIEGDRNYYAWQTPYYLLPDICDHDITAPLNEGGYYVLLPVAQGLTVSSDTGDAVVTELLKTSSSSFSKINGYNITTYEKEEGDIDGAFALSVALENANGGRAVWVTSGAIVDESSNSSVSGGNEDFFLNAIGWMCGESESSISIHSKSLEYNYLTMTNETASYLSVLVTGVIPAAYLIYGIVTVVRRKKK